MVKVMCLFSSENDARAEFEKFSSNPAYGDYRRECVRVDGDAANVSDSDIFVHIKRPFSGLPAIHGHSTATKITFAALTPNPIIQTEETMSVSWEIDYNRTEELAESTAEAQAQWPSMHMGFSRKKYADEKLSFSLCTVDVCNEKPEQLRVERYREI
ncbi:hypothetical protein EW145_g3809 [Phellinidium pouzarii]|uniref:Uncharacterized protein n=1 Tax=Phellinidium pouzarii TaxID=167371 RepID=A0A4S4L694_9AGAM|nr:hypothetical protein EW145_g3809 [Phellinidium pouzarii]